MDGVSAVAGALHYSLNVSEFTDQLHPVLGPTTLWGYNPTVALGGGSQPQRHLGGIIVAQKGAPIQLTFTNKLPAAHTLPVDVSAPTLGGFMEAAGKFGGSGQNAITTHLHGGFVPWVSDGGPFSWFTPNGNHGTSYMQPFMQGLNPAVAAGHPPECVRRDRQRVHSARCIRRHSEEHGIAGFCGEWRSRSSAGHPGQDLCRTGYRHA